jgi:hypothetical protein
MGSCRGVSTRRTCARDWGITPGHVIWCPNNIQWNILYSEFVQRILLFFLGPRNSLWGLESRGGEAGVGRRPGRVRLGSEKGVRLAQKMQAAPRIPVWEHSYRRLESAQPRGQRGLLLTSPRRHCHSILIIDCHSLEIYTVVLLSLLLFSVAMTVSPMATAYLREGVDGHARLLVEHLAIGRTVIHAPPCIFP